MTQDERLIQEAIDTFSKIRHWIDPDFYREQILPTVNRLKDRMATMYTSEIEKPKKNVNEPDTIPSQFLDSTFGYGIFTDFDK